MQERTRTDTSHAGTNSHKSRILLGPLWAGNTRVGPGRPLASAVHHVLCFNVASRAGFVTGGDRWLVSDYLQIVYMKEKIKEIV